MAKLGGNWVLVIGGQGLNGNEDLVDLISLDPANNPVPTCLRNRNPFNFNIEEAAGASLGKKSYDLSNFKTYF